MIRHPETAYCYISECGRRNKKIQNWPTIDRYTKGRQTHVGRYNDRYTGIPWLAGREADLNLPAKDDRIDLLCRR